MREQLTESKMHALDYWQVIRNRWGVILLTFFLISLASLVIIALLDKQFKGQTKFAINTSSAADMYETGKIVRESISTNWFDTEVKSITTAETLLRVIKKLDLTTDWNKTEDEALKKLEEMVDVEQTRGTEIVDVIVWSPKARESADIANAIRDAYRERRIEQESDRIQRLTTQVEQEMKSQREEVAKAQSDMIALAKKYQIVDTMTPDTNRISGLVSPTDMIYDRLLSDSLTTQKEVDMIRTQLNSLMKLDGQELIKGALGLGVKDQTIEGMYPKYQEALLEKQRFETLGFGRRHPKILGFTQNIIMIQSQLTDAVKSYQATLGVKLRDAERMLEMTLNKTDNSKEKALDDRNGRIEYTAAKSNLERAQIMLSNMREHTLRVQVDSGVIKKPLELHQEAKDETSPGKPKVTLLLTVGSLLGLILGLVLAFFLEYLDTSVKSLDDVERYLGVPVLAVIPKDVGVLHKQSGMSPDAEAYRILRTNIEFNRRSADANAITVVSGGAGEGKSTTLVNLAYICAQGGYNTLMIDGDLRRPKLHTFFDINNSVGLTNYLTTALMLEDVILQTPIENLYFMPSGILPADAAGILNSRRMSDLIKDVKNRFDLVLIDSPPILGVSDASVLASEVDLTMIVIQHRKLPRAMLMRVKQAIENVGGKLLGVVLNNVDVRSDSQYQYYTSYYTYYSPTNMEQNAKRPAPSPSSSAPSKTVSAPASVPGGKDDY